jgi:hypothetical protein
MGPRTEISPTLGIALVLGVLAALLYRPVWIGRVPFPADVVTQFPPWESTVPRASNPPSHAEMGDLATELYPWKAYTHRVVTSGSFPLWNPHLLLGAPFVGDPQTGLFYPANLLYFFLPTPLAWSLSFPLRAVLAGLGAALLARRLGATSGGSVLAGVTFAFCGWVTAFQARPHLDSCLWLPFILVAIDELQRKRSRSSIALAAAFFALPVLAGQPESAAHVTFVALAFFAYRVLRPPHDAAPPAGRTRFVMIFAAAGLLAVGLAAVQILPALEFIGQLHRTLDMVWGAKPRHEILAFVSRDFSQNPNAAGVGIPESAAYAGMLALVLSPLALLHRNRRDAVFLAALLVVAVGIVYGLWPFFALSLRVPVLRGIPNGRLLAVADLALAVLAGLGLSALEEGPVEKRRRALTALLPGAALAVSATAIVWMRSRGGAPVGPRGGPLSSLVFLAAAATLVGLALWSRLPARTIVLLAVALAAADLFSAVSRLFPYASPADIFPPAPTLDFLARDSEPHRVGAVDRTYGAGFELAYGLDSPIGFNVVDARTERVLGVLGYDTSNPGLTSEAILRTKGRLLDLMNVRYLVATTWNRSAAALASAPGRFRLAFADASVRVFENRTVLPRAFLVPAAGIEVMSTDDAQFCRIRSPDFDPARTVVLPEALPEFSANGAEAIMPPAVTGLVQGVNDVHLAAAVAEPSVLVLSQTHYPGWRVFVDDRRQPLLRADYAFVGVALPPGRHTVHFVLEPNSLRIGALITCVSLAAIVALCRVRTSR